MVRTKKHKYMAFPCQGERLEMFFDMETDRGEMKNVAGQAALSGEMERHRQLLAEWNKTTELRHYPVKAKPAARRAAKA